MDSLGIKEIKRRLNLNKERFRFELNYLFGVFGVKDENLIKNYENLSNEIIRYSIEKEKIDSKINDVNYKFERLKSDFVRDNKIDVRSKVLSLGGKGEGVLNELYKMGFINNDMYEVVKDEMWRNRKVSRYNFDRWL